LIYFEYTKYIKLNLNSKKTQGSVTHCLFSAAVGSSRFVLKNPVIGDWLSLRINSLYISWYGRQSSSRARWMFSSLTEHTLMHVNIFRVIATVLYITR